MRRPRGLDADASTYWEAPLASPSGTAASITLDMGRTQEISGLIDEPRQGMRVAEEAIGEFQVSVSTDGVHFAIVASGTWADTTAVEQVGMAAVTTRSSASPRSPRRREEADDVAAAQLYLEGTPHVTARLDSHLTSRVAAGGERHGR